MIKAKVVVVGGLVIDYISLVKNFSYLSYDLQISRVSGYF